MISWPKGEVRGKPIADVAEGAKWDVTYGELWFDCVATIPSASCAVLKLSPESSG